jgi:hypothetical protein
MILSLFNYSTIQGSPSAYYGILNMNKKKKLIKEIIWFVCSIAGGIILCLSLYDLLDVDINLIVIVVGVIVTLLAVYVVRLTLWVFKENM